MSSRQPTAAFLVLSIAALTVPWHTTVTPVFSNSWPMALAWGLALSASLPQSVQTNQLMQQPTGPMCTLVLAALACAAAWQGHVLQTALLASGMAVMLFGSSQAQPHWMRTLLLALLAGGLLNLPMAALQAWVPLDDRPAWLAWNPKAPGRAVGFLGQPNLLASLLAWSLIALSALTSRASGRSVRLGWTAGTAALALCLGTGMELTGSRTGLLELGLVGLWAWRSKVLAVAARRLALWAAVGVLVSLAVGWIGSQTWGAPFYPTERAASQSDVSSSRFWIWRDALALLRDNWLTGVGFGNFNFAWSFSEIPHRHPAHFDHTHNLFLQFAVELGVPATLAIIAVLGWAAREAWRRLSAPDAAAAPDAVLKEAAAVMLLTIGLHSMLEYPLWYTFFLLPAAFLLGTLLRPVGPASGLPPSGSPTGAMVLQGAGAAIVLGSLFVLWEFVTVLQVYQPFGPARNRPVEQRIEAARKTVFFGALGDYAAVLTAPNPAEVMPAFRRPLHYLVDSNLLRAYATAYAVRGDLDKARYVAQRVREFNHPSSADFLAACNNLPPAGPRPFQCDPPTGHYTWRDFEPPAR